MDELEPELNTRLRLECRFVFQIYLQVVQRAERLALDGLGHESAQVVVVCSMSRLVVWAWGFVLFAADLELQSDLLAFISATDKEVFLSVAPQEASLVFRF